MTDRKTKRAQASERAREMEERLAQPSTSAKWVADGGLAERLVAEWFTTFEHRDGNR
jgi:hypothetical protein